jgi:hypothetical protein
MAPVFGAIKNSLAHKSRPLEVTFYDSGSQQTAGERNCIAAVAGHLMSVGRKTDYCAS